jgi:hypothetical protein
MARGRREYRPAHGDEQQPASTASRRDGTYENFLFGPVLPASYTDLTTPHNNFLMGFGLPQDLAQRRIDTNLNGFLGVQSHQLPLSGSCHMIG